MSWIQPIANQEIPPSALAASMTVPDEPCHDLSRILASLTRSRQGLFAQVVRMDLALPTSRVPDNLICKLPVSSTPNERATLAEISTCREGFSDFQTPEAVSSEVLSDVPLKALEQVYILSNRREVFSFIKRSRPIGNLLLGARDPLNKAFGLESMKRLTLVEDDEGFVTLFCLILVSGDVDDAMRALSRFDEEWWLTHSSKACGRLNFDFELI